MTLCPDVILAAAGHSSRFRENKLFIPLHNHFLLFYPLHFFDCFPLAHSIILALSPDEFQEQEKQVVALGMKKIKCIVKGGKNRQDSIQAALERVETSHVLVHDAARPLLHADEVTSLIRLLESYPAVTLASPCRNTLARVRQDALVNSHPRKNLWELHTPQGFQTSLLKEAHRRRQKTRRVFTDDATLVRALCQCEVKILPASHFQLKVTYPEDLEVVRCLLPI